jgi:SAM-dependent methyltransferase
MMSDAQISPVDTDSINTLDPSRPVGWESRKTYADKITSGFFQRYLSGNNIIELGFKGGLDGTVPIVPQAIGIDVDYPGYDRLHLPFPDESQDAVYSSHCYEHIADYTGALREWYRVLKVGGYIIISVPHQFLFERRTNLPSIGNADHKRFLTPASLLTEIENSFRPNSYRIRHLCDNDRGFNYESMAKHAEGCFEIELVIEKIKKPRWNLDDGSLRAYAASEFFSHGSPISPWSWELDLSQIDGCLIWGPYITLQPGDYEVEFSFEALGIGDGPLASAITFDVTQNSDRVGQHTHVIADLVLSGKDGGAAMRSGSTKIAFSNKEIWASFEFRLHAARSPFSGRLKFNGVILRYAP